jgi:flagellar motility protein MotE (MotC chaperone)
MMRFIRDLRLIPIALIASACLLALKTADLVLESPYFFATNSGRPDGGEVSSIQHGTRASQASSDSWAKQMFNFPDGNKATPNDNLPQIASRRSGRPVVTDRDSQDITGSVTETPAAPAKPDGKPADAKADTNAKPDAKPDGPVDPPPAPQGHNIIPSEGPVPTGAERAILERLQERREQLDTQARELELQQSLIQSAQKRMDSRLTELKDVETRIKTETEQKSETDGARLKSLITMYENMKPRDAAKIFNGLEDSVLVQVASKINPRTMADIMAQMQPDVAQRLTVELANSAQSVAQPGASSTDLPKIDGQPTGK